jgi:uncharacterized protein YndB with AHSA1/START domain
MTLRTVALETFVIERTYNVPVDQVYRAWAEPKLKARWFAGSADALDAGYELDFRVGGREVNRGGPPGGPVYIYESQFRDIVPEQRIIYTYEMYADKYRISVSVATVQFHEQEATTRLVLTEQACSWTATTRWGNEKKAPAPFWTRWLLSLMDANREVARAADVDLRGCVG